MVICLECGAELQRIQTSHFKYKCTGNLVNTKEYKQKYPNATIVPKELCNKLAVTENKMIKKYGEEVGKQKWDEYKNKQSYSNSFEYKSKRYGWTKNDFDVYNKSRAVTKDKMIERHGVQEGLERWEAYIERQAYTNSLHYFQTTYGDEQGLQKWHEYNKEKAKSFDINWIMEKYSVSFQEAEEILSNRFSPNLVSNAEKQFVNDIEQELGQPLDYSYKNKQFGKWNFYTHSYVWYDVKHGNKIIEFHGDYWHCNPKIYEANYFHPQQQKYANLIWKNDQLKLQTAMDNGFSVRIVYESEYIHDSDLIKEIVEWLNEE